VVRDGDQFAVGRLTFDVMHTPGHTPEHLSFVLTDVPASPHPVMIFTGDFVFVGDVGRPDLLERAANQKDTMAASARALWKSLDRFRALPDHLQLQPGHGAGSACGKALGAVPSSTVGYEKLVNWAFAARTEDEFVGAVLEGQPEPPAYFARMKILNRQGPASVGELSPPPLLTASSVADIEKDRARVLLDIRAVTAYASGHAAGAINIPLNRSFTTYAGSVVSGDVPVLLVTADDDSAHAADAARELALIGVDHVLGFIPASSLPNATESMDRASPAEAITRRSSGQPVFDVRNASELPMGRVPGAVHVPFPQVVARMEEFPRGKPFLVMCQTGARSAVATSVLRQAGFQATDAGGIVQWERAGGEVE
jgi:hydroxyacylglutathione hydrolase